MSEVDRVIARGIAQMVAACRGAVLQATLRPGMTELEAAQVWAQGSERLVPIATRRIALAFEAHLRHGIERLRISAAENRRGQDCRRARRVGRVRRHRRVHATRRNPSPEELGAVARRLEEEAARLVTPPTIIVKTIGDAVMLISADPGHLLQTTLTLVDEVSKLEGFPAIRAGLAHGEAHERAGDWYGETVNLASRITQAGPPATVIATDSIRKQATGEFCWTPFVAGELKGIHRRPRLYSVGRVQ
jgi:adenylate cyclase